MACFMVLNLINYRGLAVVRSENAPPNYCARFKMCCIVLAFIKGSNLAHRNNPICEELCPTFELLSLFTIGCVIAKLLCESV